MNLCRSHYSYSRVNKEDPDEMKHRRAQYLIYKELKKADVKRKKPLFTKVVISKLKIKVRARIKRARAMVCVYRKFFEKIRLWRKHIQGKDPADAIEFAPIFTVEAAF